LTRKKYVEKFYKTYLNLKGNIVEPWAFLDCVLDESFKELETHAAFPGAKPDSRLISTIANGSSKLQKLKIDFSSTDKSPLWLYEDKSLFTSLSSLKNLTDLNLHELHENHRSVLTLIGNSCPLLTHLSISGFRVTEKDVLALILGRFFYKYFLVLEHEEIEVKKWSESFFFFELFQLPSEILTPFCFTLRHLQLSFGSEVYTDKFYSIAAFILRHLPLLEKMDGHHTSFGVVKMSTVSSNEAPGRELISLAEQFENACKKFAALPSGTVLLNRPSFSGELSCYNL